MSANFEWDSGIGGSDLRDNRSARMSSLRGTVRRGGAVAPEAFVGLSIFLELATTIAIGAALLPLFVPGSLETSRYLVASLFYASLMVAILDYQGMHDVEGLLNVRRNWWRVALAGSFAFGGLLVSCYAASGAVTFDHAWLGAYFASATAFLIGGRFAFSRGMDICASYGLFTRNVVIVGAGAVGEKLIEQFEAARQPWTRVIGIFDDRARSGSEEDARRVPRRVGHVPVLGVVSDLATFSRRIRVDDVVVALPWSADARISSVVHSLGTIAANIHIAPESIGIEAQERKLIVVDGVPTLRVSRKPVSGWNYALKRGMDVLVSVIALILLSPLLVATAIAVKLDSPGPVFFRQPRYGMNNRKFGVLKFRSMGVRPADARDDGITTRNDPRVTRVGRFIRKTSIDELPQLLNVLMGDMSIVGPRPHPIHAKAAGRAYEDVVAEYARRHRIKPGITGWAQLNGWRGETDTEEKIIRRCEHDIHYIDNWSVMLDIYIIVATVVRVPFQKNAY